MMMTTRNNFLAPFISRHFGKRPSFLLGLFFILCVSARGAFLSAEYEKLDKSLLEARYQKRGPTVLASDLENAFFYREALTLGLSIHRAGEVSQWLLDACEDAERNSFTDVGQGATARLVCSMVFAERVESASPWDKSRYLRSALQLYQEASARTDASAEDKLYAEGRLFLMLPEYPGIKATRAVLAFQFLHRAKSEVTSPQYFLAKGFERVGNRPSAEKWRSQAIEAKDRRALLDFERPLRLERQLNDGMSYGFSPRFFFSPNGGFGGQAAYGDDRIFDKDRSGLIGGFATSRGQWGLEGRLKDFETLDPTGMLAEIKVFSGEQDSFDLGAHSELEGRFTPKINRQEARFGFQQSFQRAFFLELGWIWFHQTATNHSSPGRLAVFPDANATYYSGPYFELGVDTRDSESVPRRGGYFKVFGNLPTDGLLSPRSFERWKVSGGYFLPGFFRHHIISFQGVAHWVNGNRAPWAAYVRVGSPLKGLREGRFSDRALVEWVADYAFPLGFGFGLDLFGNAASVNHTVSKAAGGIYELGGGVGLTWNSDVNRSASWQVSLGRFGGETALVASGSVGF